MGHQSLCRSSTADNLDPSQMELQTFNLLESCSTALAEIRETLRLHTERQETIMQVTFVNIENLGVFQTLCLELVYTHHR